MTNWIRVKEAASIIGVSSETLRSLARHDHFGLHRMFQNGHLTPGRGRAVFFNSEQIDRLSEIKKTANISLRAAAKVVVAQNGKAPLPFVLPLSTNSAIQAKIELVPIKERVDQVRLLLPEKPLCDGVECDYHSARFRQIEDLLQICDILIAKLA